MHQRVSFLATATRAVAVVSLDFAASMPQPHTGVVRSRVHAAVAARALAGQLGQLRASGHSGTAPVA